MFSQAARKDIAKLKKKADDVSVLLKQMAHPQRLIILCILAGGERTVGELEAACDASQSSVSQFLKGMRLEGLVESRREGKQVYYSIADQRLIKLMKSLYETFCN